jgi:hypothetical protein
MGYRKEPPLGSSAEGGDDRDRLGRVFGRARRTVAADGRHHINLAGDEIGANAGSRSK